MAKHIWSVLCERMLEDSLTKSASLIDVREAIVLKPAPPLPESGQKMVGIPVRMQLVSYWAKSDDVSSETFSLRATLRLPDRKTIALPTVRPTFSTSNYRQQFAFDSMPYVGPGRYWFMVEGSSDGEKWDTAAEIPFEVKTEEVVQATDETLRDVVKPRKKKDGQAGSGGERRGRQFSRRT